MHGKSREIFLNEFGRQLISVISVCWLITFGFSAYIRLKRRISIILLMSGEE